MLFAIQQVGLLVASAVFAANYWIWYTYTFDLWCDDYPSKQKFTTTWMSMGLASVVVMLERTYQYIVDVFARLV